MTLSSSNSKRSSAKHKTRYERKCRRMDTFFATSKLDYSESIKDVLSNFSVPQCEAEPFAKRPRREPTMKPKAKLRLTETGVSASLDVAQGERVPLFLSDLQDLLLYAQLGSHSPCVPRWCQLDKYNQLVHTTVLVVENVSLYHFSSYESFFPYLSAKFCNKLEFIPSAAYKMDMVQDLATLPLTVAQTVKLTSVYGSLDQTSSENSNGFDKIKGLFLIESDSGSAQPTSLPTGDKFPRTDLLLSGWQMVEENYPLPIKGLMNGKYVGYVLTKDSYKDVTPFSPMFGIDCEMCLTTIDLELTRVSIVDESGSVIYEELVKPEAPIKNYLTEYSGITAKMMKHVTKRLKDVQEDLRQILPPDAILVGQSLGNDMHALKMMHPYVIDTSVIYNITGDRKRKAKLQVLAEQFLQKKIQTNTKGHCSVEDSLASLNLTKHKLQQNIFYGDAVMSKIAKQVRQYPHLESSKYVTSFLREVTRMEKTSLVVGLEDITARYCHYTFRDKIVTKKICCISEVGNQSVINRLCESGAHYSFNIGHIRFNETELDNDPSKLFKKVDDWIQQIDKSICTPALRVVIFGGQRDSGNGCFFVSLKKCP
ncbi:hypothetical protein PPYR_11089 [Photinus pyralis]|uniref:Exonuclease domain-containing protein n=1 Tax=Photinus pyralis TaxID=7054 RepID=A0A1Y1LIX4_PHOPY|nr:RNA exonuclease 5-like isoform X1 [Photinus pyralis]KAB0797028.1 hypothetical protein PPYR_11089 [Photinus pyralis]